MIFVLKAFHVCYNRNKLLIVLMPTAFISNMPTKPHSTDRDLNTDSFRNSQTNLIILSAYKSKPLENSLCCPIKKSENNSKCQSVASCAYSDVVCDLEYVLKGLVEAS